MGTFLFDSIIIGPIRSRRLGSSLGVNLLKPNRKLCNFDCIYCECGWNDRTRPGAFNSAAEVLESLEKRLNELARTGDLPDAITFAGNGEPTMHPDFEAIIDGTIALRDRLAPRAKIAVLSNATMIHRESVHRALMRIDRNILKLDSALPETAARINQPQHLRPLDETIALMQTFHGELVVQTLFLQGTIDGQPIDNSTPAEVEAWIGAIEKIAPAEVMIYTLDRATPASGLAKVPHERLLEIEAQLHRRLPGVKSFVTA